MSRHHQEEAAMKFILTFTLPPKIRDEAIARFLETGGRPPPGVTLSGRWTRLDLSGGVALLESEDPQALTAFAHASSDLLDLSITPVLEDQELAAVLTRAKHPSASAEVYAESVPPETYPEDAPVAPETTPGTTKPPYEEIA
jgi:hypothetical protein